MFKVQTTLETSKYANPPLGVVEMGWRVLKLRNRCFYGSLFWFIASIIRPFPAESSWVQDGTILNANGLHGVAQPGFLTIAGGTPYITWAENNGVSQQAYVKFYNGVDWQQVGGPLNLALDHNAGNPSLFFYNGVPYAAWNENNGTADLIQAKQFNGVAWQTLGTPLNVNQQENALYPRMKFSNSTPFVSWFESNGTSTGIFAKWYNGADWLPAGTMLNANASANASWPVLGIEDTTPYVAWQEENGTAAQGLVKRYNGVSWQAVGTELNIRNFMNFGYHDLAFSITTPYVSWIEFNGVANQLYVKRFQGGGWLTLGEPANVNNSVHAFDSSLAFSNTTPYVAWVESNGSADQAFVKYYNGSAWTLLGGALNINSAENAWYPILAITDTTPYVSWSETNHAGIGMLVAKHFNFNAPVTPSATSATPSLSELTWTVSPNLIDLAHGQLVHISLQVPYAMHLKLEIYNLNGRKVWSSEKDYSAGNQSVSWDGGRVGSGTYLAVLSAPQQRLLKKLVLIR